VAKQQSIVVSTLLSLGVVASLLAMKAIAADAAPALVQDPTRPSQYSASVTPSVIGEVSYQVASIIKRKHGSQAIINGQPVSIGHQVDGAKVVRITPTRVLLKTDKKTIWVSVTDQSGMKVHRR